MYIASRLDLATPLEFTVILKDTGESRTVKVEAVLRITQGDGPPVSDLTFSELSEVHLESDKYRFWTIPDAVPLVDGVDRPSRSLENVSPVGPVHFFVRSYGLAYRNG